MYLGKTESNKDTGRHRKHREGKRERKKDGGVEKGRMVKNSNKKVLSFCICFLLLLTNGRSQKLTWNIHYIHMHTTNNQNKNNNGNSNSNSSCSNSNNNNSQFIASSESILYSKIPDTQRNKQSKHIFLKLTRKYQHKLGLIETAVKAFVGLHLQYQAGNGQASERSSQVARQRASQWASFHFPVKNLSVSSTPKKHERNFKTG